MHLTDAVLEPLRERYGEPRSLRWEGEVTGEEFRLAGSSPERRHDVTFFVFDPARRLALIQKPSYPEGVWRPPGGGVQPEERFETGVQREAMEELGIHVELERFLVSSEATFRCGEGVIDWRTHVFSARTEAEELDPIDTHEISAARWGTSEELAGRIRARLLETGRALWRYRVALHDASLDQLEQLG
jgi:ADP-ribose pyrophosphatase YjhB (NUDIX family)